ncbi:MAG: hypothetical protein JRI85_00485 [Deltaproteobacteria bacterium]|nr:hypothetical protein [Deltaproteobacteria bacterium]
MKPFYSKERKFSDGSQVYDAATVILLRERDHAPFEFFLMRRHRKQNFMASAFVFPGGRLDEADCDPDLTNYAHGLSVEEASLKLNEPDLSKKKVLGLFFTAVRETFEEAGVLLASEASGGDVDFGNGETETRFNAYRMKIHEHEMSLTDLAQAEDICFRLDLLRPYAHWITPKVESKRFDTRFLLARMPSNQVPIHDSIELTESLWITPADALKRQEAGEILLMPPTLKTTEELAEFSSIDQLFKEAASREIQTILPQAFQTPEGFGVKLPYDPEYTLTDSKLPPRPGEPSRIVMVDGRWQTIIVDNS